MEEHSTTKGQVRGRAAGRGHQHRGVVQVQPMLQQALESFQQKVLNSYVSKGFSLYKI